MKPLQEIKCSIVFRSVQIPFSLHVGPSCGGDFPEDIVDFLIGSINQGRLLTFFNSKYLPKNTIFFLNLRIHFLNGFIRFRTSRVQKTHFCPLDCHHLCVLMSEPLLPRDRMERNFDTPFL